MDQLTPEQTFDLAVQHHQAGRLNDAQPLYRQVLTHQPRHVGALHNLGVISAQLGRKDLAADLIRQALALKPDLRGAHYNLANALKDLGQLDEAIAAYRKAIALQPNAPEPHNHLGIALTGKGQIDEAITEYRQALALKPNYAEASHMLGISLRYKGQHDEAIASFRQAIAIRPDFPEAHVHLAYALKEIAELDQAIASFRQALVLRPGFTEAHSSLIFTMHYHDGYDLPAIDKEHRNWNRRHAEPLRNFIQPHSNDPNPNRRVRIGYVSCDFRADPSAFFIDPLLHHHDHQHFEIFVYAQMVLADGVTQRMQKYADRWQDTRPWTDQQMAQHIRDDRIDILVDMKLHAPDSRLLVFARKPAPIQISWLGYPGSSGLDTIDYRITDRSLEPNGSLYPPPEQPMYIPECFWCYDTLAGGPDVEPLPAPTTGHITFGSLNNFCKINDTTLRLWSGAMKAVPGSRMLILAPQGSARPRLLEKFAHLGVDAGRIEFIDRRPRAEYLKIYHRIDIGLDTLPYSGHTTSMDSLWMGVPVVTLPGTTPPGRVGLTHAKNLNLPEHVAASESDFPRVAARLAADLSALARLRSTLRQRMETSPLMNGPLFARSVEAAYRQAWRTWCESASAKR